jgi:glutamine synthetase
MSPGEMGIDDVLERLENDGIEQLWITYHDYNGKPCAKTVPKEEFRSALSDGIIFAYANLNFDLLDHQAPGASFLADSGDFHAVPDPRSYAVLAQYPDTARMHTWMRRADGSPWDGCPRTRLDAMVETLRSEGLSVQVALEPEFYFLTRDERGEYHPTNDTRMYTQAALGEENDLIQEIFRLLHAMQIPITQLGKEYGRGQYELTARHGPPVWAVDSYLATKDVVRDVARSAGYVATFMPKPYADWPGNSLHVHVSLWDADGESDLTSSADDDTSLSDLGMWFLGGLLAHAPALTGLGSPTVNSYKRLQPGTWAPANTYWGYGNRSGVIRVPGTGKRRRIEYRSGDNSCQPFMFVTGLIAAGLDGIRNRIDPGPPFQHDIGHLTPAQIEEMQIGFLPRSLPDAFAALESDRVIVDGVGAEAVKHMLTVKRAELTQYELAVHGWERDTYLETL